jgi:hypothetical protein
MSAKGVGGSIKLPVLLTFNTIFMLISHLKAGECLGGSEKVQNYADVNVNISTKIC